MGFAAKVPVVNALDNFSDARQVEAAFIKVAKITKVRAPKPAAAARLCTTGTRPDPGRITTTYSLVV